MPNTAARYDSPWKAALTHAFQHFIVLFFPHLHPLIDWTRPAHFRDKELAGISLGAIPGHMVADQLIEVGLLTGRIPVSNALKNCWLRITRLPWWR